MKSLAFSLCLTFAAAGAEKPNVIFLLADDMRADSVAALGNPDVKTPNLDSLVKRGFHFTNAYCLGGNSGAVCTPSRNMILSGNAYFRWANYTAPGMKNTGMLAPAEGVNFPTTMSNLGYQTYHHGKRGNTAALIQAKFEINKYLDNETAERKSGEPGKIIVDDAISFLKTRKDERPIFMYLAFANPHDPRVAAKKYLDQYDSAKLALPKNFKPLHPFDNGDLLVRDEKLLPWPRTETDLRNTLREYYATVTALDGHIGRLIDHLKQSGQLENTIIVFSADQGIALGSHGLLGKQNLYDHSMKSPLVFSGPGIAKGKSDALVYLFDIFPTVVDYAARQPVNGIDGLSFRPAIDQGRPHRDSLLLCYLQVQRAVRDGRWKLIRYPQIDKTQLFDLQNDPDELIDLSAKEPGKTAVMIEALKALQSRFGDKQPLTAAVIKPNEPVTAEWLNNAAKAKKQK